MGRAIVVLGCVLVNLKFSIQEELPLSRISMDILTE